MPLTEQEKEKNLLRTERKAFKNNIEIERIILRLFFSFLCAVFHELAMTSSNPLELHVGASLTVPP